MKKIILMGSLLSIALLLNACGMPAHMIYEKKEMNTSDVEEILEARLEMENPNMDLNVTITEDND